MNETPDGTQYSILFTLYLAFEPGNKEWKPGFTIGLGQRPRKRKMDAGHLAVLEWEIRSNRN